MAISGRQRGDRRKLLGDIKSKIFILNAQFHGEENEEVKMNYGETFRPIAAKRFRQLAEVLEGQDLEDLLGSIQRRVGEACQAAGFEKQKVSATVGLCEETAFAVDVQFKGVGYDVIKEALREYVNDPTSPVKIAPASAGPVQVVILLLRLIERE